MLFGRLNLEVFCEAEKPPNQTALTARLTEAGQYEITKYPMTNFLITQLKRWWPAEIFLLIFRVLDSVEAFPTKRGPPAGNTETNFAALTRLEAYEGELQLLESVHLVGLCYASGEGLRCWFLLLKKMQTHTKTHALYMLRTNYRLVSYQHHFKINYRYLCTFFPFIFEARRLILVFVRSSFVPLVENTRCTSLGIGVGGYGGNKGAVAVRFDLGLTPRTALRVDALSTGMKSFCGLLFGSGRSSFCFVNVHLAAGQALVGHG